MCPLTLSQINSCPPSMDFLGIHAKFVSFLYILHKAFQHWNYSEGLYFFYKGMSFWKVKSRKNFFISELYYLNLYLWIEMDSFILENFIFEHHAFSWFLMRYIWATLVASICCLNACQATKQECQGMQVFQSMFTEVRQKAEELAAMIQILQGKLDSSVDLNCSGNAGWCWP